MQFKIKCTKLHCERLDMKHLYIHGCVDGCLFAWTRNSMLSFLTSPYELASFPKLATP